MKLEGELLQNMNYLQISAWLGEGKFREVLDSSRRSVSLGAARKTNSETQTNACGQTQNVLLPTYRPPSAARNMTAGLWFLVVIFSDQIYARNIRTSK